HRPVEGKRLGLPQILAIAESESAVAKERRGSVRTDLGDRSLKIGIGHIARYPEPKTRNARKLRVLRERIGVEEEHVLPHRVSGTLVQYVVRVLHFVLLSVEWLLRIQDQPERPALGGWTFRERPGPEQFMTIGIVPPKVEA